MPGGCVSVGRVRLPSLTGTDAARLARAMPVLESRVGVVEAVRDSIAEMEASPDPVIVLLVGEWGEGKTSVFSSIIAPSVLERGWRVLETRASTILGYLESFGEGYEKSPSHRVLAAILAAGLEAAGDGSPGPERYSSLRSYIRDVLARLLAGGGKLVVFIDEFEDVVASGVERLAALVVSGLVGLVNGDVVEVSGRCEGDPCWPGSLHLVLSLTPPAYVKLTSYSDFATIAARFKRRVRIIRIPPLSKKESIVFLNSLARYSFGGSVSDIVEPPSTLNSVIEAGQGNMGALVLLFRALVSRSLELGRAGCGGLSRLDARELVRVLSTTTLAIGGAEIPAMSIDSFERLMEAWISHVEMVGFSREAARRFLEEAVARTVIDVDSVSKSIGVPASIVEAMVAEANGLAPYSWVGRELGVERMFYSSILVDYDDALKTLMKLFEEYGVDFGRDAPATQVFEAMVKTVDGLKPVVAIPSPDEARSFVRDALAIDIPEHDVARIAGALAEAARRLRGLRVYVLNPRLVRLLYGSPELGYLDFIVDRVERLRVNRRVFTAGRDPLVAALVAVVASEARVVEGPQPVGEGAVRLTVEAPGVGGRVRLLLYASPGQVTLGEAERIEATVTGVVLSGWRPHAIILLSHGGVEEAAREKLERLERNMFVKIIPLAITSMTLRAKIAALGVKLIESSGSLADALREAVELREPGRAARLGFDPLRLQALLREVGDQLQPVRKLREGLEKGVDGVPLVVRDPSLGYDVEKPTELAGALRYYLVVPAPRTTPANALRIAHDYVLRYHVYRHGGGEARGFMSPDIDRRELTTLERYTTLLIANGFLERVNGELRIDTLSPGEKAVLRALEQLGAYTEPVQASAIWSILVDATTNPGTKRMLLQSLAYRGLIETSGRRIDPERSRVRLVRLEEAEEIIEKARQAVEALKNNSVVREWGYIASAKARDYRVGSIPDMVRKLEAVLSVAENALKIGNRLMALRLAKTVLDLADHVRSELLGRIEEASRRALEVKAMVSNTLEKVREVKAALEKALEEHVTGVRVEVVFESEERLVKALKAFEELMTRTYTEQELEEIMARLWSRAVESSAREPGKHTPFYINGLGPSLEFNIKLWMVLEKAREAGVIDDIVKADVSKTIAREVEAAEEILKTIRATVERLVELREIVGRQPRLVRVEPPSRKISVRDVAMLVEKWRLSVGEEIARLERIAASIERLREEHRVLAANVEKAKRVLGEAEKLLSVIGEARIHYVDELYKALEEARTSIAEAEKALQSSPELERVEETLAQLTATSRRLAEVVSRLDSIARTVKEAAVVEVNKLRREIEALARLLGVDVDAGGSGLEELPKLYKTMQRLVEEVRARRILGEDELKCYLELVELKAVKGEVLLSEAARYVASRLGVEAGYARKIIVSLIERGLIEPKI